MTVRAASKPIASPAASPKAAAIPRPGGVAAGPIDRNSFEDEFPLMFKFYSERGKLSEAQLTKVQDIQQRWKVGCVYWLTHDNQEIEIPEWVAVNVVVNNKQNLARGSRICMSLNHTKGYGCNRLAEGTCSYVHECALCGEPDHGVFQKRSNGAWACTKLRKWYDEEARYKAGGFGDPRKREDELTDIAKQPRKPGARKPQQSAPSVWGPPVGGTSTASTSASSVSEQVSAASPAPSAAHLDALELLPEAAVLTDSVPSSSRRAGRKAAGTKATAAASTAAAAAGSTAPAGGREAASAVRVQPTTTPASPGGGGGAAAAGDAQQQRKKDQAKQPQPNSQPQPKLQQQTQPKLQQQPEQGRERRTSPFAPHLRPPPQPPPPRLPANWKALWCDDHQAYYFWHTPTNVTTWEAPGSEDALVAEPDGARATRSEEGPTRACSAASTENSVIKDGRFVCTQHWRPQPGIESCMKVFQGEVVVVTWTDGEIGGWAYGHTAEDVTKTGYFPQGVLAEARSPPDVGEVCTVAQAFTAPEEVGGYMSIETGQQIKVLHIEGAWAYVELLDRGVDQPQVGWVPSMFLSGSGGKDHDEASVRRPV